MNQIGSLTETGKYLRSNTHQLLKFREHLILSTLQNLEIKNESNHTYSIVDIKSKVKTPFGELQFSTETFHTNNTKNTIYVDEALLQFPLILRLWQSTDTFQPIGMKGQSKKLSKFLKDEKLTPLQKQQTYVLTSNNKVVWVLGLRADERFKVTSKTTSILKIKVIS